MTLSRDPHRLHDVLRSLDPASPVLTAGEQARAGAALERIVASDPAGHPAPSVPHRRPARRLLLSGAAAAAVTLGSLTFLTSGGDDVAYASWTPDAVPLSQEEISVVAPACRRQLGGGSLDVQRARLALAERRGDHVVLLYRTEDPDVSGACLARNPRGSTDVDDVSAGIGGSDGPAQVAPAGGFTQGAIFQARQASITDGAVGPDVVGVTIHAGPLRVQASVRGGRYVAWWPGAAFPEGPEQPSGRGGPEPFLTYDLTLADGTVLRDVDPTRPR